MRFTFHIKLYTRYIIIIYNLRKTNVTFYYELLNEEYSINLSVLFLWRISEV